jgi:Zn-dependent protease
VYLRWSWLILAVGVIILYAQVAERMLPQLNTAGEYAVAAGFLICLLLSVLLHELGHALVARRYKIGVRAITLELLGGYTEMESDSPSARADLFVSIIGPIISAVIGVGALGLYVVLEPGTVGSQLAFQLAGSNLIVAVFNALPGLPLDGGRALRALIWGLTGNRHTGSIAAGWIGRAVALITLAAGLFFATAQGTNLFSLALATLVAVTLWQGATAAIAQGRLASRLPRINLRQLSRPLHLVASGTPLAEAMRQLNEGGVPGASLAVADTNGAVIALVYEQAAAAVPVDRRPWVPVDSVARTLEPGRTLTADLTGEAVIKAVQANPAPAYLVISDNGVVGVLRTADLAKLLNS